MADERSWRVELTADDVPELQLRLEWALQHQNQRLVDRVERTLPPSAMRSLLIGISLLGLGVLVFYVALEPRALRRDPWLVWGGGSLFVLAFVIGLVFPRLIASRRRFAGRSLARAAERIYRPVKRRLPYTIDYRLGTDVLVAGVGGKLVRRTDLARIALVIDAGPVLFGFRFAGSFVPARYVYVSTDEDRAAVVAAFIARGARHVVLTGPVEGFTAPVPEARVRTR